MPAVSLTSVLLGVAALLLVVVVWLVWRRRRQLPEARLRRCCAELMSQVLIPTGKDGEEAEIHLEYALLCSRGIVVLNLKHIIGNVFGSDAMQEWAVLTGKSRFGFANPQDGLYDRVAAVKALLPGDIPVRGYIAFGKQARFTKGVPSHVVMFDELIAQLEADASQGVSDNYRSAWEKLRGVAQRATS